MLGVTAGACAHASPCAGGGGRLSRSARFPALSRTPRRRPSIELGLVVHEAGVILRRRSVAAGGALVDEGKIVLVPVHEIGRDHVALLAARPGAEAIDLPFELG